MNRTSIIGNVGCSLFLLCAANASAQSAPASEHPPHAQVGIGFLAVAPVGEFGTDVDAAPGVLLYVDVNLGRSIFSLGGEFGALTYGSETRRVDVGNIIPDIPNLSLKVGTDNEMWLFHGRIMVKRRTGRWQPYAAGLVGLTNLATRTSIKGALSCTSYGNGNVDCDSETAAEATNARDTVGSYGGAAGVTLALGSSLARPTLDFSLRYLRGGEAVYLTEGAIDREGGRAILNLSRSRTDMVSLYVGVAFGR